jgi:hypothetical protein
VNRVKPALVPANHGVDVPTFVRGLLTAPVFAEDEEKNRIAGLLQPILITVMVLVMLLLL